MEYFSLGSYEPIKTALNELGFTVNIVEKLAQKTVITVSHYESDHKRLVSAEKQEANDHENPT